MRKTDLHRYVLVQFQIDITSTLQHLLEIVKNPVNLI